jgi:hypothetical protein
VRNETGRHFRIIEERYKPTSVMVSQIFRNSKTNPFTAKERPKVDASKREREDTENHNLLKSGLNPDLTPLTSSRPSRPRGSKIVVLTSGVRDNAL